MQLAQVQSTIIEPCYLHGFLPQQMDSWESRVLLLAIGGTESNFEHRDQLDHRGLPGVIGPACGFWQFELGNPAKMRNGVSGVMGHQAARYWLHRAVSIADLPFEPRAVWAALTKPEFDLLACALARLLLFTDPYKLPALGDEQGAWNLYAKRTWRPGKPHRERFARWYSEALRLVTSS